MNTIIKFKFKGPAGSDSSGKWIFKTNNVTGGYKTFEVGKEYELSSSEVELLPQDMIEIISTTIDNGHSIYMSVSSYNAKGDGVNDDTSMIVSAITAVAAAGGGIVYFPKGNYKTTANISVPKKVSLLGEEKFAVKFTLNNNTTSVFTLEGNQEVHGLSFNSQLGVRPTGDNVTISDCNFSCSIQGIQNSATVNNLTVTECLFDGCGYGILSNINPSYDVKISNCHFVNTNSDDIEINSASARWIITDCTFKNNVSTAQSAGFAIGMALNAKDIRIANCIFENIIGQAIHAEDHTLVSIENCSFKDCGSTLYTGSPICDIVILSGADVSIKGCTFHKSSTGYSTVGVCNFTGEVGGKARISDSVFYQKSVSVNISVYNSEFIGDSSLAKGSKAGVGIDSPAIDNEVIGCKFTNLSKAIILGHTIGGSYGGIIKGNIFTKCDFGLHTSIRTSDNWDLAGRDEFIDDNTFFNCKTGIKIANGMNTPRMNYTVTNNKFQTCDVPVSLADFTPGYSPVIKNNVILDSHGSNILNSDNALQIGDTRIGSNGILEFWNGNSYSKLDTEILKTYQNENRYKSIIKARHKNISNKFYNSDAPPKGMAVGDSICQGAGAEDVLGIWAWITATKLQIKFGNTTNSWHVSNFGVGGSTIYNNIAYLSHLLDENLKPEKGKAFSYDYWVIITGRNDSTQVALADFSNMYRTAVRSGIRAGIDVICVTEPPTINITTGEIEDLLYPEYANIIRRIAAQEGASLVDAHAEWMYQKLIGTDLRTLSSDGTHPNNAGYAIIGDLIYRCMIDASTPCEILKNENDPNRLGYYAQSTYKTKDTYLTSVVVPEVTTATTSRKEATGVNEAIKISNGGYAQFLIPNCRIEGVIITFIAGNSGKIEVQSPWGLTLAPFEIQSPGGSVREFSVYAYGNSNFTVNPVSAGDILVRAKNGDVIITGVHIISPILVSEHATVTGLENGAPWNFFVDQNKKWKSSNVVSNTIKVKWYGTDLAVDYARGTDFGILGFTTDGDEKETADGYVNNPHTFSTAIVAKNLTRGWHETVFSVEPKNATSTSTNVAIRNLQIFSSVPIDGTIIALEGKGITNYAIDGKLAIEKNPNPNEVSIDTFRHLYTIDGLGREIHTDAILAAIDSLPTINQNPLIKNGKIIFSYDKYRMANVQVPMGVSLEGVAPVSNIANPWTSNNGTVFVSIATTGACITFTGQFLKGSGCSMKNIKMIGGNGTGTDGLVLDDIFFMKIQGCVFENLNVDNAILLKSSTGNSCNWIDIDGCLVKNIGDYNNYGYGRGIYMLSGSDSNVVNTSVETCGGSGIGIGGKNNKIIDCFVDLNKTGISISSTDNSVLNTSVKLNFTNGILVNAGAHRTQILNGRISNNNKSNTISSTTGFGIDVIADVNDLMIANTFIEGEKENASIRIATVNTTGFITDCRLNVSGAYGPLYDPYEIIGNKVLVSAPDHIQPQSLSALPTAAAKYRGKIYRVQGGTGVADALYICQKLANETYNWIQIG
ncbi:Pectate lyase superfamily protein [compost metagenome]